MDSHSIHSALQHEAEAKSAIAAARTTKLFEPVQIGSLTLKNRIVMPTMTTHKQRFLISLVVSLMWHTESGRFHSHK